MIAVRPQPCKTVIGAQEYILRQILDIHATVPGPIISHEPPEIGENLVVMPLDQFFKAQRHFVTQLSVWYNHEAVVL